jgi:hypothetical protein
MVKEERGIVPRFFCFLRRWGDHRQFRIRILIQNEPVEAHPLWNEIATIPAASR